MGVIDLDARVKKLEQGGAGGAEIDQIEADLTALENTVDGLIEDVSNKITLNTSLTGTATVKAFRIGPMLLATATAEITAGAAAFGTQYDLFDIDTAIAPEASVSVACLGVDGLQVVQASSGSKKIVTKGGNWVQFGILWKIATPTP